MADVVEYCERRKVSDIAELAVAPYSIRMMLTKNELRTKILKFLNEKQQELRHQGKHAARIYADEKERKEMAKCHKQCIKLMRSFLN